MKIYIRNHIIHHTTYVHHGINFNMAHDFSIHYLLQLLDNLHTGHNTLNPLQCMPWYTHVSLENSSILTLGYAYTLSHAVTHCHPHLSTAVRALQYSTAASCNDHTSQAWQRWLAQTGDLDEPPSEQTEHGFEKRGRGGGFTRQLWASYSHTLNT